MNFPRPPSGDQPPDTIVAISTPPGRGGIGAVRLSGPDAVQISRRLFRPLAPSRSESAAPAGSGLPAASKPGASDDPGRLVFGRFVSDAGETIDHGYLVTFRRPRSFTGEDSVELWAHGSPVVLRWIIEAAVAGGARPATPGEFTLRAFLNGRIDATQAEAIRDLIEARTSFQVKVAHDQVEIECGPRVTIGC